MSCSSVKDREMRASAHRDTYANSTNQSCSITVKSLMKLFEVSTTSWNITHPVVAVRVNNTDDGCTFNN